MRALFEKIPASPTQSFRVEERRISRFDSPWHFHPEIELTCILESRGRRFVGDSAERFAEGDLVLLGPNLPHFWHNEDSQLPKTKAHSIVVQFDLNFLGPAVWEKPEFAAIRRLLTRANRGLHFPGASSRLVVGRLRLLTKASGLHALTELLHILHLLAEARGGRSLATAAYEPSLNRQAEARLARVYAYLMENFRRPLTLAQIARIACMTPEAFSRYFKRVTGRNVSVFLTELRIDYAARLLRESNHSISDTSGEAGFVTLSSFNRHFRERMNCTPRHYRQVYRES